jgi:hypothetical protein
MVTVSTYNLTIQHLKKSTNVFIWEVKQTEMRKLRIQYRNTRQCFLSVIKSVLWNRQILKNEKQQHINDILNL